MGARRRLRQRTLPAIATALLVQISNASVRPGYDLRALSSAVGLAVLLALALLAASVDALAARALTAVREAARVRIRFGPARATVAPAPPPIDDRRLVDERGRPLRGAARQARIAALQRERSRRPRPAAEPLTIRIPVPSLPLRWVRTVAITTTMTFVFATTIGVTGFIAQQGTVALGASTTLTIISGEVSVRTTDIDDFRPVADGALLRAGMTIRTGADTYAVLTYFEGSTVSIEPGTILLIEALRADPDGSTVISMQQPIGRTWHAVSKLLHQNSRYEVRTPTATATVRGTLFAVGVTTDEQGEVVSTVETTEGAVATAKLPTAAEPQPQEVVVTPGLQATVKQSAPLEAPKPAPEPDRKVTVTVGAAAGVVLDPVGRANGIKDGKVVVQTPGARVALEDGRVVVALPNVADGKIAAVVDRKVAPRAPVEVVTTVSERGRGEQRAEQRVGAATPAAAVTAVEVKKGESVAVASVSEDQKKDIAASVKVADAPKVGVSAERKSDDGKEAKRDGSGGPGGPGARSGFVPAVQLPPLPAPATASGTELAKRTDAESRAQESSSGGREQPKQEKREAPKVEAPRFEPPKFELPKVEAVLGSGPKNEPAKVEAPKVDQPKQEAPKQEAPKEKTQAGSAEVSHFMPPAVALPPIPFGSEASAPKKEGSAPPPEDRASGKKEEASTKEQAPKIELPKIELPIFRPAPEKNIEPARPPEPANDKGGKGKDSKGSGK